MPVCGMRVMPRARSAAIESAAGAGPLPLRPCTAPVEASCTIANRSPPMPFIIGATAPMTALAAMAASTAWPPRASTEAPACDASGCSLATTPPVVMTIERACARSMAVRT